MTKSAPRKLAPRKARSASKRTVKTGASKRPVKASTSKPPVKGSASKRPVKGRDRNHQTPQKMAAKLRSNVAAETIRESHRMIDAQFAPFRQSQVPDTVRVLAERNVAQARELYEGSKNTLQAVLESWQKSFGAAGQGAAALNGRFIELAERNINTGFDLATGLAGARNLAEVMDLQAAYWRELIGDLHAKKRTHSARRRNQ